MGEDYDMDEINYIFVVKNKKMKKIIFYDCNLKKVSVFEFEFFVEDCRNWIEEIFKIYLEINFIKDVLKFVDDVLKKLNMYVDFFVYFIMKIFVNFGLIFVDLYYFELRKLEILFFK